MKAYCSLCGGSQWQRLGSRTYRRAAIDTAPGALRKQLMAFHDEWFPDVDVVTLSSLLCTTCGLVTNHPRPRAVDHDRRFRNYYEEMVESGCADDSETCRASGDRGPQFFEFLTQYLDMSDIHRVLYYGLGSGYGLEGFVQAGMTCKLIGPARQLILGVARKGLNVTTLDPSEQFDLLLCNHVFEHALEPRGLLQQLCAHVTDRGYVLAEVSLDIWDQPPLPANPIGPINFFTPGSLCNLLGGEGLDVGVCCFNRYPQSVGPARAAIRAVGAKDASIDPADWDLLPPHGVALFAPQEDCDEQLGLDRNPSCPGGDWKFAPQAQG